jgi:plastocyanin domain-containing protein
MNTKHIIILATVVVVGGIIWLSGGQKNNESKVVYYTDGDKASSVTPEAVREEDGVQIIHVLARGGYTPRNISAAANKPTKFEIETKGTYDCSSSFTIPSLNYRQQLPASGMTLIDIPPQEKGTRLTSACSMGMYTFDVMFN